MSVAVFDVGGTFIKYCLMTHGKMSYSGKIPTPYEGQEVFLQSIENILATMSDVEAMAFSMPGVIDVKKKYIYVGGSLTYNHQTDVKEWEKRFHLPIEIENDARCAAIAEMTTGHMKGIQSGVVLTFGTGVGGGLIIHGDLYKGSHLIGGETSMIFSKDSRKYGSKALFGAIGSVANLVERLAKAKGQTTTDGREVFQWIQDGDEESCCKFSYKIQKGNTEKTT